MIISKLSYVNHTPKNFRIITNNQPDQNPQHPLFPFANVKKYFGVIGLEKQFLSHRGIRKFFTFPKRKTIFHFKMEKMPFQMEKTFHMIEKPL